MVFLNISISLVVLMTKIPIASAEIWHKINLLETFYFCHYFAEDIINFVSVMAKNYFKSYIWLLETLQSRGPLTLKQIQELWLKSSVNDERKPLAPRTFANHIASIADTFKIYISFATEGITHIVSITRAISVATSYVIGCWMRCVLILL